MGVGQIASAALDVDLRAEVLEGDGRALDVPAGTAPPEGRIPRGLARPFGAPEEGVQGVALADPIGVTTTLGRQRQHLVPEQAGGTVPKCGAVSTAK